LALLLGSRQATGDFLHGLASINPDKISSALGSVHADRVADVLKDAKIPDSIKAITPAKAVEAIKSVGADKAAQVAKAVDVAGSLKDARNGLQEAADKLNRTRSGPVGDALREVGHRKGSLADTLQRSLPKDVVETVRHADPKKVEQVLSVAGDRLVEAIKHTDPEKVEKALKDPNRIQHVLKAMETVDWWSQHWYWVALVLLLLAIIVVGVWYTYRTVWSKSQRSPNLLVDAEINMWVGPSGGARASPTAEETEFTQF